MTKETIKFFEHLISETERVLADRPEKLREVETVLPYYRMAIEALQERPKGRWIELPCQVGDTVYIVGENRPAEIEEIRITPRGIFFEYVQLDRGYEVTEVWDEGSFCPEDIGKDVFLTIEERNDAEDACGADMRESE